MGRDHTRDRGQGAPSIAALAAAVLATACGGSREAELPRLATVPAFTLVDQSGARRTHQDLRGKVWVADFFFTRCPTICPKLTALLGRVRERTTDLGDRFHLVSFTVDPEHDTPAVLSGYARQHSIGQRWMLLTGPFPELRRTIVEGLKVSMGRETEGRIADAQLAEVFHGTHFVLVDPRLVIRGYYGSDDTDVVDRLVRDAGALARDARAAAR